MMLRISIVLALLVVPAVAFADDARTAMHDYFDGEQRGGYVLIGMGVGGLVAGGLMYRSSSLTLKGASYPLLGVGLLHAAAGIYINIASARRVDQFDEQITTDSAAFVREEQTRMAGVSTQFTVLKIAELAIAAGGLTMAGIGWRTDRPRLKGAGLAVAAEMLLTFGFDIFAARRAHEYRDRLAAVSVSSRIDAGSVPSYVVAVGGEF